MLKRKLAFFVLVAAGAIIPLGIECLPEPDVTLNLLGNLGAIGGN